MAKTLVGMSSDPHFNSTLFVISFFVQELKRKLDFEGQNELNCRVKFGLVMTVQDWVQALHQDFEVTPENHSWIFRLTLCTLSSYLYIWGEDGKEKNLVWIPLGRFWCCAMMCGMVVFVEAQEIFGCMVVFLIVLILKPQPS